MTNESWRAILGFAAKAGRCAFGADAVDHAIKSGRAKLVLIDEELSGSSKKAYHDMCEYYDVRIIEKKSPCAAAGKPDKMAVAVNDKKFADTIAGKQGLLSTEGK